MGRPKLNRRKEEKPFYMPDIADAVQWSGMVHLNITNEDDESLLGMIEFPKNSGREVYACATSGLMFDKQTGRCIQSSNLHLKLDSVRPHPPMTRVKVKAWADNRQRERDQEAENSRCCLPPDFDDLEGFGE